MAKQYLDVASQHSFFFAKILVRARIVLGRLFVSEKLSQVSSSVCEGA